MATGHLSFLSNLWLSLPLQAFCALDFSQIPVSGSLCICSWTSMPAHLPDILSGLDRQWQATDWGVEPFCWRICSLQCPATGAFVFRGLKVNIISSVTFEGERGATVLQELRERDYRLIVRVQISRSWGGKVFLRKGYTLESFLISLSLLLPSLPSSFLFFF